ncbi:MAG: hypothetical protein WA821_03715, partial [Anaerolineales bacterium]
MDQIKILKRALTITVKYRVLWVFGILLALTAGGGGGNGGGSGSSGGNNTPSNGGNPNFNWRDPFNGQNPFAELQKQITPEITNTVIGVAIALACIILVLIIIGTIVRYVSETALIRMVDRHENSGEKLTVREGFRLGWSRAAWKMFLMDLLTGLVSLAIVLAALLLAASPLLVWLTGSTPLQVLGTIVSVGLILLVVFAVLLAALALTLVLLFARRVIVLEDLGVVESLRRGYTLVRARLGDIILMAVIMFGIGILWALLMIPVMLAIIVVAAVIAGLPALLVGGIAGLLTQGATPWIVAAVVGVPIFLIVVVIPGSLVGGWQQVFSSSAWT